MEVDGSRVVQILTQHPNELVREAVKAAMWQAIAEAKNEADDDDSV